MALLRNPSGRVVDVASHRVRELLAQGFEKVVYSPLDTLPDDSAIDDTLSDDTSDDTPQTTESFTIEEGNNGWFTILKDGEKITSARGIEAAEAKLAELNS